MLFGEISFRGENHMKHMNILSGENAEFLVAVLLLG